MANIKVKITNSTLTDNSKVLSDLSLSTKADIDFELADSMIRKNAALLSNISESQLDEILKSTGTEIKNIDRNTPEYAQIVDILESDRNNKDEILKKIAVHVGNFAEGVLSNVIANLLTPR